MRPFDAALIGLLLSHYLTAVSANPPIGQITDTVPPSVSTAAPLITAIPLQTTSTHAKRDDGGDSGRVLQRRQIQAPLAGHRHSPITSVGPAAMVKDTSIMALYAGVCNGHMEGDKVCASAESMFVCHSNGTAAPELLICPTGYVCCHTKNVCNKDNTCSTFDNFMVPSAPTAPWNPNSSSILSIHAPKKAVVTTSGFCNGAKPMRVGYITSWGQYYTGGCKYGVNMINPKKWTHLIYAFGSISGSSIILDPSADLPYVKQIRKRGVKVMLSVGGWGAAGEFVTMAGTDAGRVAFAKSALSIFKQYGFDGIDLDWEFPQSYLDANGKVIPGSEGDNLSALLVTMRYYFNTVKTRHLLLSLAVPVIPTVYNYPLKTMAKYADFVNVMTYDLNGPWDSTALPNTDNRIIKATFASLLNHAKFPRNKLLLGLAFYGRTYQLLNPSTCKGIGCAFNNTGHPLQGTCAQQSGYVYMNDVRGLIAGGAKPQSDAVTGTSWLISGDSWVTYDSKADFKKKDAYAKSLCLGGTFVWEIDQDPQGTSVYWGNV
ncbi:hypothetical protein HDU98_004878 [Podochytrium sp. JEL0797]|nr:hypothetical protein HDU98_004878 [Podochytrium sp. JEL0797]